MRLFGFELTRVSKAVPTPTVPSNWLSGVGGWWPVVREPFAGAWQQNMEIRTDTVLTFSPLYRCITLISQDIAKMGLGLVQQDAKGVWTWTTSSAFSPVLKKQNRYQTRIQFIENWVSSKLITGNTYVLKGRDERGIVNRLFVLDPLNVKVLVAPDGSVFYQLRPDDLTGVDESDVMAPASEIIHDRYMPLYHPLCGIPPISACALSGMLGLNIQRGSSQFFNNGSRPGGVLSAPGVISDATAKRLKDYWDQNYSGENVGKIAVLGDGLKFEAMRETSVDAQLVEQFKLSGENVCTAFGVPAYKVGIGPAPTFNNVQSLNVEYYSNCLQTHIEAIELLLDEGLGLTEVVGKTYGTMFDTRDLLRMDTATKTQSVKDALQASFMTINEARAEFDLSGVEGGDTIRMQQQYFALPALVDRDNDDPFSKPEPAPSAAPSQESSDAASSDDGESQRNFADLIIARAKFHERLGA